MIETGDRYAGATFSNCERYRYELWRRWGPGRAVCFVMLNPSTANASTNDPTVERCQRRARIWQFDALFVANIFAFRSTDPGALYRVDDPIGRDNDEGIRRAVYASDLVVCAWGNHGAQLNRGARVLAMLRAWDVVPHALRLNDDGSPGHPLYVPYAVKPFPLEGIPA